jgi:hypothetical protein
MCNALLAEEQTPMFDASLEIEKCDARRTRANFNHLERLARTEFIRMPRSARLLNGIRLASGTTALAPRALRSSTLFVNKRIQAVDRPGRRPQLRCSMRSCESAIA